LPVDGRLPSILRHSKPVSVKVASEAVLEGRKTLDRP